MIERRVIDAGVENQVQPRHFSAEALETWLAIFASFACAVAVVYHRLLDHNLAAAFYGWSPTGLMRDFWFRPSFSADFPGGETEGLKSVASQAFPLFAKLGISDTIAFGVMILVEVVTLATGATVATRLLNSRASLQAALLTGLFLFCSTLVNVNLVRWGHPYYGSVYNYAYGTGLIGAALVLKNAPLRGAFFLGLTTVIHPTLGVLFGIFCFFGVLPDFKLYKFRNLAGAAAVFLIVSTPWLSWTMRNADLAGEGIPSELFIAITRMMSFHWFPISGGVFGRIAYERFVPFLGFLILIAIYLFHDQRPPSQVERRVGWGLAGSLAVTFGGILASEYSGSPLLVKLAFGRESSVLLLIGALFVVPGLLNDVRCGQLLRAILAAAILIVPFFGQYGVPIILPLTLGIVVLGEDIMRRNFASAALALAAMLVLTLGVLAWLAYSGSITGFYDTRYTGLDLLMKSEVQILFAVLLGARLVATKLFIPIAIGAAGLMWAPALKQFSDEQTRAKASAYLDIQLWAKNNTPPDALFAPDPGHAYGWRQYSERPSFGSVREWLYAGWIYNSRPQVFREGLARFEFLGMNLNNVLEREKREPDYGTALLPIDAQKRYYNAPLSWFRDAARIYNIQYFVFDESIAHDIPGLKIVYRNSNYTVRIVAPNFPSAGVTG